MEVTRFFNSSIFDLGSPTPQVTPYDLGRNIQWHILKSVDLLALHNLFVLGCNFWQIYRFLGWLVHQRNIDVLRDGETGQAFSLKLRIFFYAHERFDLFKEESYDQFCFLFFPFNNWFLPDLP